MIVKNVYSGAPDKTALKDALGGMIERIAAADPSVVYLDADLMSCISTKKFAANNPDRAFNCGISEANMIGVACGLAASGMKPIAHTFGPFASRRVFDQVFLSAGYAGNDITVIGTDPGVCAGFNGGTHMPFEDIAIYRTIPTATIIDITDAQMLCSILPDLVNRAGVKYMRLGRKANIGVYEEGQKFEIGKGVTLREGKDCAIIACGIMVPMALAAAETLAAEGICVSVVDMFTVKPLDEALVLKMAETCGALVTCENHNRIGGLTGAVSETLAFARPTPLECVAIMDEYGEVGPQNYLEKRFDLTPEHIVRKVKAAIARK